eukprot:5642276-Prymnesium_polylepis.1
MFAAFAFDVHDVDHRAVLAFAAAGRASVAHVTERRTVLAAHALDARDIDHRAVLALGTAGRAGVAHVTER